VRVVGFQETSLVDWDGRIAAVVFVGGCNFTCPFCHNHAVADDDSGLATVSLEDIGRTLHRKRDWYYGVVITGGEPMLHPEIFDLCRQMKQGGRKVKLDTNGSFPYPLKDLIELRLVDYVAMDIKAPLTDRYSAACGHPVEVAVIRRSIRLLRETGIEHEFRTTLVPGLVNPEDMPAIGAELADAPRVVLQHFQPAAARVPGYAGGRTYSQAEAEAMAESLRPFVKEVRLRGKFL
jgi:pyruvate formate lyase activating enzyme